MRSQLVGAHIRARHGYLSGGAIYAGGDVPLPSLSRWVSLILAKHLTESIFAALDIRAMQAEFKKEFREIVHEELLANFGRHASPSEVESLFKQVFGAMLATLDTTTTMDAKERMAKVASSGDSIVVKYFTRPESCGVVALSGLSDFGDNVSKRAAASLMTLRRAYLDGSRGPAPASDYLLKTRPVYEFVREKLGIGMHGLQNHESFPNGLDVEEATIGENVSLIHEVREAPTVSTVQYQTFIFAGHPRWTDAMDRCWHVHLSGQSKGANWIGNT